MSVIDGPRNFARNAKTLGKPGFLRGEDTYRTFSCFPDFLKDFQRYRVFLT
jgi:hypothetical protein